VEQKLKTNSCICCTYKSPLVGSNSNSKYIWIYYFLPPHCGTCILPTRPRSPQSRLVEGLVYTISRWSSAHRYLIAKMAGLSDSEDELNIRNTVALQQKKMSDALNSSLTKFSRLYTATSHNNPPVPTNEVDPELAAPSQRGYLTHRVYCVPWSLEQKYCFRRCGGISSQEFTYQLDQVQFTQIRQDIHTSIPCQNARTNLYINPARSLDSITDSRAYWSTIRKLNGNSSVKSMEVNADVGNRFCDLLAPPD